MDKITAFAAEADLGSLFLNNQEIIKLQLALDELRHPQPLTQLHTDNTIADCIIHQSINQQRSRAINLQYLWTID